MRSYLSRYIAKCRKCPQNATTLQPKPKYQMENKLRFATNVSRNKRAQIFLKLQSRDCKKKGDSKENSMLL
ncbi:Hypothetical predicted protein [Cloeon dipterum]|uniref:Uncharacterized protein n=1 Tax=Cloeon dipterum TaxID=197152 RepID=A0A8S1DWF4_9INSE|nr:Hypothetical predicted protein [Cloeon dipterum]